MRYKNTDALAVCKECGEWIEENSRPKSTQFLCSACGGKAYSPQPNGKKDAKKYCPYKYCPNCGARMKGADDD